MLRDWEFDRERFGVPGPLYRACDHTHWLALETAAGALADAGCPGGDGLDRDSVGVVLGNSLTGEFTRAATLRFRWPFVADAVATALDGAGARADLAGDVLGRLERLVKQPFPVPGDETLAGSLANTIAGRICNHFDFHGTGYTVDGACSSSLLAVATAGQYLANGQYDVMLAGGVDMSIDPLELVGFSRLGALAGTDMRVYDARPTGFLPGEGCGIVVLMRAEDADRLGLRTYGHLVGWASSSDGAGGLTRPARDGQVLALRRAYRMAGLSAGDVGLIEGHGTGTAVGDRVELEALSAVRAGAARPAALGTVKANIGHTKAAAGVAGLIKATLAVHHRVLPPTTGCEQPHALLRKEGTPLRVLPAPECWTDPAPRAGVSSMGFGGINVHLVVAGQTGERAPAMTAATRRWSARVGREEIVVVGAGSPALLADRLHEVAATASRLSSAEVRDVAATAWHDGGGPFRAALVARSPDELTEAARRAATAAGGWDGGPSFDVRRGYALGSTAASAPRIGLLFPGQAAPVRPALPWWADRLDLPQWTPPEQYGTTDTAVAQPAIVRQTLAGLAWLRELGCAAVAAAGHSLGEISALHWSGACSATTAMQLAQVRGAIMAEHGDPGTTMASLAASADRVAVLLDGTAATIAGYNAPSRVVISGPARDVDVVVERARDAGLRAGRLAVSHGFHSPAIRPAVGPLRKALRRFRFTAPTRPVISTVTGTQLCPEVDLPELLAGQLVGPVRFGDAVTALARQCDLLLEVGPGGMLTELATANQVDVPVVAMDCAGDPRQHAFATALLAACATADLEPWFATRPFRRLALTEEPRFVANPCETRSGWTAAPDPAPRPAPAPAPPPAPDDPLAALTAYLSDTLELPPSSIKPDSFLLADLHLNSLQVVQAVAAVATALDRHPPGEPLSLGDATVREVAEVLRELPAAGAESAPAPAAGVRGWVHHFTERWQPFGVSGHARQVRWSVQAPAGHWLHELASATGRAGLADGGGPRELVPGTGLPDGAGSHEPATGRTGLPDDGGPHEVAPGTGRTGLAVALPDGAGPQELAGLLRRIAAERPEHLAIVHYGHPAAVAVARSVAAELAGCQVVAVRLPDESYRVDPAVLADADGYLELRVGAGGGLERVRTVAMTPGEGAPPCLGAGDLCLVTGGVRGITALAAAALAESTGCTLVFAGRTPAEDPGVVAALHDLRERVDVYYRRCDIADPDAVRDLLAWAWPRGEIRGLLHGAGVNEPRRLGDVTAESLRRTLRPKVDGLRVLLDAAGAGLALVVGFGSIIGRQGLAGQAEYCLANDWLRVDLERWASTHPQCRTHLLEWSLWSGTGMGVRLDVLDNLRRQGVEPIEPRQGVAAFGAVLADPDAPVTVLVSSRFPATPTLTVAGPADPLLRFAERTHARVPGVEAVVEADLSLGADPYLADHRIDGTPVLPAVVGLEAMTQAALLAGAGAGPWSLTGVEFRSPVVVDGPDGRAVRLAALTTTGGADVVLRDDTDRFHTDRFVAHVGPARERPAARVPAEPPPRSAAPHPFYGHLLFHSGRFRRLAGYTALSAFRVDAWIQAGDEHSWFSQFHSPDLLLGDPGAHDAALHALLACVPHRRALPVGVDRVTVWGAPRGPVRVLAWETAHSADEYTFTVELVDRHGAVVSKWQGLRLRVVAELAWPQGIPRDLVGPWLSRKLIESGFADGIELVTTEGNPRNGLVRTVAERFTPAPRHVSASYAGSNLLLAFARTPVGVTWEMVPDAPGPSWPPALRTEDRETAEVLADKLGEPRSVAVAHLWTAREALNKLGLDATRAIRIDQLGADGLVASHAGAVRVVTAGVRVAETGRLAVAAIAPQRD